jgi:hypothetical protein
MERKKENEKKKEKRERGFGLTHFSSKDNREDGLVSAAHRSCGRGVVGSRWQPEESSSGRGVMNGKWSTESKERSTRAAGGKKRGLMCDLKR